MLIAMRLHRVISLIHIIDIGNMSRYKIDEVNNKINDSLKRLQFCIRSYYMRLVQHYDNRMTLQFIAVKSLLKLRLNSGITTALC